MNKIEPVGKLSFESKTAEFYLSEDESRIFKIYRKGVNQSLIMNEIKMYDFFNHYPHLNVPNFYAIVDHKNRVGLSLEKIDGMLLTKAVNRNPWFLFYFIRKFAALHTSIHNTDLKDVSGEILEAESFNDRFDNNSFSLTHGDYHFDNILITRDKQWVVIDWMNGRLAGNAQQDVCRTYLSLKAPSRSKFWMYRCLANPIKQITAYYYLKSYCKLNNLKRKDILKWTSMTARKRILEGVPKAEEMWWEKLASR